MVVHATLPSDVRQSIAELRQPGAARRVSSWLAVAAAYALAGAALYLAVLTLFFGDLLFDQCMAETYISKAEHDVDDFIGAFPALLRGLILTEVGTTVCRKIVGLPSRAGLLRGLLTGVGDGDGDAQPAGWMAIVGSRGGEASAEPQSTWKQAREARDLPWRQAIASAATKLLLWHWSQPVVYLWMLAVYRCFVASLGVWQQRFASIVAVREVLYLCSTLLATWQCPVFLLMDPSTAWGEADTRIKKVQSAALYILTPHNYVALCLANRFRGWRRTFLGLAGIQVLADLASSFALGALLAAGFEAGQDSPTALVIGYVITASGFVLFFGPLSVITSLRGAADRQRHTCARAGLGLGGCSLLSALIYIVLIFILMIGGWFNPYCSIVTLHRDFCGEHGTCYGAVQ
eukprot:COSAG02_NODE_8770_length_2451_cov_2.071854_1_plen_403_part_10